MLPSRSKFTFAAIISFGCLLNGCANTNVIRNSLSRKTYAKLRAVHTYMESQAFDDSLVVLLPLTLEPELNDFEYAITWRYAGYAYGGRGEFEKGAAALTKSLSYNVLPQQMSADMGHDIVQMREAVGSNTTLTFLHRLAARPAVRIAPMYPRAAANNSVEGWVTMRFTISETGAVTQLEVIDAQPPVVFDRAAMQAVQQWQYKPTIVKGKPVARPGIVVKLRFNLGSRR